LTGTSLLQKWLLVVLIRLGAMPIERSNVPGLAQPPGYAHLAAEERALLGRVWQALLDSEPSAVVRTSATLLGVRHLGYEGQLVEIECTAALPLDQLGQQPD